MTETTKLRMEIELDIEIDKEEYPELTAKDVKDGIFLRDSDEIDGFELTTDIPGLDYLSDFFLKNGKILKQELVQVEETFEMTDKRKTEIIDNFLGWMIEHHNNDEDLYLALCKKIGMTKEELNEFSIESLDEYYEKEHEKEKEETTETLVAEDVVEMTAYALHTPDGCLGEEQAKNMLGMVGANIMDESIYEEPDYEKEVEESIAKEFADFKRERTEGKTAVQVFEDAYEIHVKMELKNGICEDYLTPEVYKALYQKKGGILQALYDAYQEDPNASVTTNTDAREFVERYCEKNFPAIMNGEDEPALAMGG